MWRLWEKTTAWIRNHQKIHLYLDRLRKASAAYQQCCGSGRFLTGSGTDFRKRSDLDPDVNKISGSFLLTFFVWKYALKSIPVFIDPKVKQQTELFDEKNRRSKISWQGPFKCLNQKHYWEVPFLCYLIICCSGRKDYGKYEQTAQFLYDNSMLENRHWSESYQASVQ
jgi:hypothetical protein